MRRQKAHILSKEEEALLAQVGNISQAPGTIFSMLNNADLKFPKVKNEKGEEVELTQGRYIQFLESKDREVRKDAFQSDVRYIRQAEKYDCRYAKRQRHEKCFLCQSPQISFRPGNVALWRQYSERSVYEPDRYDSRIICR